MILRFCKNALGMIILLVQLGIYHLLGSAGIHAHTLGPMTQYLLSWALYDPTVLKVFNPQNMIPSISAFAYGLWQRDFPGLKQLAKSHLIVAFITAALKFLVGRVRPHGGDKKSFPSGHTSFIFTGASYIHYRYGIKAAIPAYLAASLVACVRVFKSAHHTSDVVVGAGIALLTAYNMVTDNQEAKPVLNTFSLRQRLA